jgi:hypothetical protein
LEQSAAVGHGCADDAPGGSSRNTGAGAGYFHRSRGHPEHDNQLEIFLRVIITEKIWKDPKGRAVFRKLKVTIWKIHALATTLVGELGIQVCTSQKDPVLEWLDPERIQEDTSQIVVGTLFCPEKGRMSAHDKLNRHNMYRACPKSTEDTLKKFLTVFPLEIPQAVSCQKQEVTLICIQMAKIQNLRTPACKSHIGLVTKRDA